MSGTQQWPPPAPPPVVFTPPEPEPPPEPAPPVPAAKPRKAAKPPAPASRPFGELTDDEFAEAHTEARRLKAQMDAEARRRAGKPLGRTGPDRQPRKPYRDRAALIAAARKMLAAEGRLTVAGLMKSLHVGHTVAKEVIAALEAKGVIERDESGWFEK